MMKLYYVANCIIICRFTLITKFVFVLQISAADLANLEVTTTTVTTEKSKAPLARPEEVGS